MKPLLDNISIVLVDTKTPANIGATARCMMNMGLSRLILVDPPRDPDQEASKLAAGAQAILEQVTISSSLLDAVAEYGLVIGTSRHAGRQRKNIRTPREMAEQVIPILPNNRVAIVFGNEVNGLEMKDLALCHEILAIPSSDAFPSLNLSHAVMVVAYELYMASGSPLPSSGIELAEAKEVEAFYSHLRDTLLAIGFLDQENQERMMFSFRQLFGRARLDSRDVSMLRGILSAVERSCRSRKINRD
jgi:TrmH family RNA methyltransferase